MLNNTGKWLAVKKRIIILVLLALSLSEIFLSVNITAGFILYVCLIAFFLLSLSHIEFLNNYGKLIIIFMIVPIVRITGLFMQFSFFWKLLASYSILLFLSFYYSVRFKLDHGHKKEKLNLLPLAIIIGGFLGLIGDFFFNFEMPQEFIYLVPLIAYSEEILFRGMIQNLFKRSYGINFSILATSFIYGIFSLSYGFLFALFIFFAGIIISITYNSTRNIFLTTVINMFMHIFLFVIPKI